MEGLLSTGPTPFFSLCGTLKAREEEEGLINNDKSVCRGAQCLALVWKKENNFLVVFIKLFGANQEGLKRYFRIKQKYMNNNDFSQLSTY